MAPKRRAFTPGFCCRNRHVRWLQKTRFCCLFSLLLSEDLGRFVSRHQHKTGKCCRSGKRSTEMWNGFLQLIEQTGTFFFSPLSPPILYYKETKHFGEKKNNSQHIFKFLPPASSPSSRAGRSHYLCKYVLPLMSLLPSLLLCWPLENLQGLLEQISAGQKGLFFTEAATEHVCYA